MKSGAVPLLRSAAVNTFVDTTANEDNEDSKWKLLKKNPKNWVYESSREFSIKAGDEFLKQIS